MYWEVYLICSKKKKKKEKIWIWVWLFHFLEVLSWINHINALGISFPFSKMKELDQFMWLSWITVAYDSEDYGVRFCSCK